MLIRIHTKNKSGELVVLVSGMVKLCCCIQSLAVCTARRRRHRSRAARYR